MYPFHHPGPYLNYCLQPHPDFLARSTPGYYTRQAASPEETLPALPRPRHIVPSALTDTTSAKEEPLAYDIPVNSRFAKALVKPAKSSYGKLVFHTKPESFGNLNTWSQHELLESRRIVEFRKVRVCGDAVHLDCRPIRPHEYSEDKMTISCIYWIPSECEGEMPTYMGRCVFTSVDVIALLAKIAGRAFPIMEKNRIRRNLEGCGPQTVKKEGDTMVFFNQLMRYEHPKTRNIEKDIKVFKWENVGKAMRTIFQRYVGSKNESALAADEKPEASELEFSGSSQDTQGMDPRMVGEFGREAFGMEAFEGYSHGMIPGDFSLSPQRLQM
jgi:hypothetical protein